LKDMQRVGGGGGGEGGQGARKEGRQSEDKTLKEAHSDDTTAKWTTLLKEPRESTSAVSSHASAYLSTVMKPAMKPAIKPKGGGGGRGSRGPFNIYANRR